MGSLKDMKSLKTSSLFIKKLKEINKKDTKT